jgi:hypothetical protein
VFYLSDETIEIGVRGTLDVQVPSADVVDGLIVDHESAVRVLQSGVGGQDGVVRLNDCSGDLKLKAHEISKPNFTTHYLK